LKSNWARATKRPRVYILTVEETKTARFSSKCEHCAGLCPEGLSFVSHVARKLIIPKAAIYHGICLKHRRVRRSTVYTDYSSKEKLTKRNINKH